jgi:O-antigen ligase
MTMHVESLGLGDASLVEDEQPTTTLTEPRSRLTRTQRLLVGSLVLGIATQLRVGPIGAGEVLAALYLAASVARPPSQRSATLMTARIQLMGIVLALSMALGSVISAWRNDLAGDAFHDVLSMSLAVLMVLAACRNDFPDAHAAKAVWRSVIVGLTSLTGSILLLGQVVRGIGPIDFWYRGSSRFCGLSANPNQVTVFFGFMPAATMFLFRGRTRVVLVGVQLLIGLASRSDGFQLAQVAALGGAIVSMTVGDLVRKEGSSRGALVGVGSIAALAASLPFLSNRLSERGSEAFAGGGNGRTELLTIAFERIPDSPVFGFGPGSWVIDAVGKVHEAHNNYVDLLLRGGLVGTVAVVLFQLSILKDSFKRSPALFGSVLSLVAFGMTGFQLRWPIHWFAWVIVGVLCAEQRLTEKTTQIP